MYFSQHFALFSGWGLKFGQGQIGTFSLSSKLWIVFSNQLVTRLIEPFSLMSMSLRGHAQNWVPQHPVGCNCFPHQIYLQFLGIDHFETSTHFGTQVTQMIRNAWKKGELQPEFFCQWMNLGLQEQCQFLVLYSNAELSRQFSPDLAPGFTVCQMKNRHWKDLLYLQSN